MVVALDDDSFDLRVVYLADQLGQRNLGFILGKRGAENGHQSGEQKQYQKNN